MPLFKLLSSRTIVRILIISSVTFLWLSESYATLCVPSITENDRQPNKYIVSFIDSLGYAKESIARVQQGKNTKSDDTFFDLMYALKLAKSDLECAASLVSPYTTSVNEAIKVSASSAELSFIQLAELQAQIVAT
jgi:hypothetical protein